MARPLSSQPTDVELQILNILWELGPSPVREIHKRLEAAKADMSGIDGVRVKTADGWWLLRASNTQDVVVARCEARDDAGLARLKMLLTEQLRASGMSPPPGF